MQTKKLDERFKSWTAEEIGNILCETEELKLRNF